MDKRLDRSYIVCQVIQLLVELSHRSRNRFVCPINKGCNFLLEVNHLFLTGDGAFHSEQRSEGLRDPLFIRATDLQLDTRILVEIIQSLNGYLDKVNSVVPGD